MSDAGVDVAALERQLADLAVSGEEGGEVLLRLAEVIFPGGAGLGDLARIVWPEPWRLRQSGVAENETIDDQGRLEARIRESEIRFRSLVEQLPAVVFFAALGDRANEVYISPQIEALLGYTQQEWLENPMLWYTQLHPDDHDVVIEAFTRGVQTGQPFRAQVRFTSREGEEVWILGEARLVLDQAGRPAYFQGVAFDVTPTKRAEEALAEAERARTEAVQARAEAVAARNCELTLLNEQLHAARDHAEDAARARSAFLATMSHELRTPLNSVIVLADLLADGPLSPLQDEMVRKMRLASDHLLAVIDDVLEFSRLRAGHVELHQGTFEVAGWLADTVDIVAPRAAAKGLALRHRIVGPVPPVIAADQGRLRQVLLNVLANAVKFTAHGHVEVLVSARPLDAGRFELECAVSDTGVGIDPDAVGSLFDEFRQADSGIAREFGGSGLGLAISRQLCQLLGGRIWVDPAGGPGATLRFTWIAGAAAPGGPTVAPAPAQAQAPVAVAVAVAAAAPAAAVSAGHRHNGDRSAGPGALRILVVDDDVMNQQVVGLLLNAMGHRPDVVDGGQDAIAAVTRRPYDTVLMDIAMPVVDGLRATRAIRDLGSTVHQPYIVALTANALPGDFEACIAAGMNAYVAKPIQRHELARALAAGSQPAHRAPDRPGPESARDPDPDPDSFDPAMPLRILHEFGPEPLQRLVAIFADQAPRLIDAACHAVAAGNPEDAARAAHTLKSSAAATGATGLATLCAHLETLARSGTLQGATAITAALTPSLTVALHHLAAVEPGAGPAR